MIERILANCEGGMDLRDQAAVFRTSHDASQLGVELVRRNIPFVKFGGLEFLEAAHVKDVLAVLRWGKTRAIWRPGARRRSTRSDGCFTSP